MDLNLPVSSIWPFVVVRFLNQSPPIALGGKMSRHAAIFIICFAAIILFSASLFAYSETPSFCTSCHVMAPKAMAWGASRHAQIGCLDCHAEPGMVGNLKSHLAGVKQAYLFVTGQYITPIKGEVKNELCLKCHPQIANTNAVGDIVMVHGRHMSKGVNCTDCHARLTHQDPTSLAVNPAEQDCLFCHQQKDVQTECVTCHLQPFKAKR
jgi:hypothetical protein